MKIIFAAFLLVSSLIVGGKCLSQEEAAICVGAHNKLRELHKDTPDLQWDSSLAAKAQEYAEKLVTINKQLSITSNAQLSHSPDRYDIGENLYWRDNKNIGKCAHASHSWYNEIKDYSFLTTKSTNGKAIGHFTQLVWKDSTHFGVGIATMPSRKYSTYGNKETFIVAMYSPAGNTHFNGVSQYSANVKQRKDGCSGSSCTVPTAEQLDLSLVPSCANKDGDTRCQVLFNSGYDCHGPFKSYFRTNCFKACGYC